MLNIHFYANKTHRQVSFRIILTTKPRNVAVTCKTHTLTVDDHASTTWKLALHITIWFLCRQNVMLYFWKSKILRTKNISHSTWDGTQHSTVYHSRCDPNNALECKFSWHFSQFGFEVCFSQIIWVEVVQSGLSLSFLLKWSQTWRLLDAWACLWWNHSSLRVLVSSFLFREMHRPEVFYMSLTIVYHTFCLHHPKPTGTWAQTNPTLCPSGALLKHFRKTQAIQPTVHYTSITERCSLSRQDVLQCLVNLTYLPKIMVSIQSESLKFYSYKTDEPTVAAPLDCRLGPGVVR